MVSVSFWSMAKKRNSTKRPVGSGTTYSCVLKDNTSVLRPQIELDLGPSSNPASWNVCYIQDFGRYYFCSWTYDHGRWIASCEVDTLATYKPAIGAAEMMVLRSSSAYDEYLVDNFYPASSKTSMSVTSVDSPFTANSLLEGTVILQVIGQNSPAIMAMPYSHLETFWDEFFEKANELAWGSQNYGNLMQFIKNVFWIPVGFDYCPGIATNVIDIGNIHIQEYIEDPEDDLNFKKIYDANRITIYRRFPITLHPQSSSKGIYLNTSAFTQHIITIPSFGSFTVPNDISMGASSIQVDFELDASTGQCSALFNKVYTDSGETVIEKYLLTESNVSIPILYGSAELSDGEKFSAISNVITGVTKSLVQMTTDPIGGLLSSVGAVVDLKGAWQPQQYSVGSVGSLGTLGKDSFITSTFKIITDTNWSDHGRPLFKNKVLSTIPGFIQTGDSEIELNATQEERETVGSYLTSGFFYE